jgi:hypothetical protein
VRILPITVNAKRIDEKLLYLISGSIYTRSEGAVSQMTEAK